MTPRPPRKSQGTDGNGRAVCVLRISRREHTVSDHVVYLFSVIITNYIMSNC